MKGSDGNSIPPERDKKIKQNELKRKIPPLSTDHDNQLKKNNSVNPSQNHLATNEIIKVNTIYLYDDNHKGPYMVYVDTISATDQRKALNETALARHLVTLKINGVLTIDKIGYGRAKITFNNSKNANEFAADKRMMGVGYQQKIFAHFICKTGIIFDVPEEIPTDELKETISSDIPIVEIIRVTRKEGESVYNTRRVKIIFKGLELPERILLYGVCGKCVKYFIPFGQCYRCFRFNHHAQHCKARLQSCKKCFFSHSEDDNCANTVTCSNCKGDHTAIDKECPARKKAYAIKKTMIIENLSFKEANTKYKNLLNNQFALLDDENITLREIAFPPINRNRPQIIIKNNTQESARSLYKNKSFASAAKPKINIMNELANTAKTNMLAKEVLSDSERLSSKNGSHLEYVRNSNISENNDQDQSNIEENNSLGEVLDAIQNLVGDRFSNSENKDKWKNLSALNQSITLFKNSPAFRSIDSSQQSSSTDMDSSP